MVSLEQARAEIDELEAKIKGLQLSYSQLRAIEVTATRILRIISRMSGSEDVDAAIRKLQHLIVTVRLAQATIHAFQLASGPIGWSFALVGAVGTAISVGDMTMEIGS